MLPTALINPGVVTFPPAMFPVTLSGLTTLPARLKPLAFKFALIMLPPAEINPPVSRLPPVILLDVLITWALFNGLSTDPLRLKPTAFKLPPVTLALAENSPPMYKLPLIPAPPTTRSDPVVVLLAA